MPVLTEELVKFKAHRWQVSSVAFNHNGSLLASGGWDKEVNIWDLSNLPVTKVNTLKGAHRVPITSLCWHHPSNGRLLCTGSADCTAVLWHTETGNRLARLSDHSGWVLGTCFSKTGSFLATACWDHMVRIWDPAAETLINELKGHNAGVWSVDFHPKSSTLCTASEDGTVKVWDARTNRVVRTMSQGHSEGVYTAKWSPDGAMIASGSADTKICIWEPSSGSVINTIYGHIDTVKDIVFNPHTDNVALPIIASAGDFTIHITDPRPTQRANLLTLSPHMPGKEVETVDISPDGSLLISGGRDGYLSLMSLFVPSLIPHSSSMRQKSISSVLRKSRQFKERSYIYDATVDDLSDVPSEVFDEDDYQAELEADALDDILSKRIVSTGRNAPKLSEVAKMKRASRLGEKQVDLDDHATVKRKGPNARESRGKRVKEKAVDIPTMIAHLAATNSRLYAGPDSSSGSDSEDERSRKKPDLLGKVLNRISNFDKKDSGHEALKQKPPPQRLSLLPDGAAEQLRNRRGVFENEQADQEPEEQEEHGKSETEDMRTVMSVSSMVTDDIGDDEYYATLLPSEIDESPGHMPRDDSMMSFDSGSLMHSGYNESTPDYLLNSSLRFEDFKYSREMVTSSPVDATSPTHRQQYKPTLAPPQESAEDNFAEELGSGDEYGDEVPLSMI